MSQKDFAIKQALKGKTPTQIHQILVDMFESDALPLSTISYTIRSQCWKSNNESIKKCRQSRADYKKDHLIESVLKSDRFATIRQIAKETDIAPSTVHWILRDRLGYKNMDLSIVPHELTSDMKKNRVDISIKMIETIKQARENTWNFFSTGDESWFYYYTSSKKIWIRNGEKPPSLPNPDFHPKKMMVTIFWSPNGIQSLNVLPQGHSLNAQYFQENTLAELVQNKQVQEAKKQKQKYVIHFDNASVHMAKSTIQFFKENNLEILAHPAYSPDLAPSDFYLFGYLKEKAKGKKFCDENEIIEFIREEFYTIPKQQLESVFKEWERRLKQCINSGGEYI